MFETFYGLTTNPFRMSADEHFRYAHRAYVKAWSYLKYALEQAEGFVLITGRPGTGKTTLIRDTLSELDTNRIVPVNLATNQFQGEELLRMVALEHGFPAQDFNKATLLTRIGQHAQKLHEQGRRVVVIVDEAQNLSPHGLEELRLLSNLQIDNRSLFQIVLVGQEELRNLIYGQGIENVQQRIIANCRLEPMQVQHVQAYVEHRLSIAGWDGDPAFEPAIYPLLYLITQGVPREINLVLTRLLLYGSLEQKHRLTKQDLLVVLKELDQERRLASDQTAVLAELQASADDGEADSAGVPESTNEKQPEGDEWSVDSTESRTGEAKQVSEPREKRAEAAGESDVSEAEPVDAETLAMLADEWSDTEILGLAKDKSSQPLKPDETIGFEATEKIGIDELPALQIELDEDRRRALGLFMDVGGLPGNGKIDREGIHRRWRWFFYPLAIALLLMVLLVPKPGDLTALWNYVRESVGTLIDQPPQRKEPLQQASLSSPKENTPAETALATAEDEPANQPLAEDEPTNQPLAEDEPANQPLAEDEPHSQPLAEEESPNLPLNRPSQGEVEGEVETSEQDQATLSNKNLNESRVSDARAYASFYETKRYWLVIEEASGEPADESRALHDELIAWLVANPSSMVVLTGVFENSAEPLMQIRDALGRAEQAAALLVRDGISPRRIVIEGKPAVAHQEHSGVKVWVPAGQ